MNRSSKWALLALVVGLLGLGLLRLWSTRQAEQEAVAKLGAERVQTVFELRGGDLIEARTRELMQTVRLSGTLKAVNSAMVKARVAGELQDLAVREGDMVRSGQVIARVDATEYQARLRQAQQLAESAKGQVDIARRAFDNNRSLVEQGFISKTALDTSLASLASAEASLRAAQAGAEVAAKALEDTVLRAPINGLISQRLAQPGERVAPEARIVEIVDLSRLELESSLSAAESMSVRVGQSATLQIEGSATPVQARVVRVNPSAVTGSRAVLVYLAIDAAPGLRQGLFAQGALATGRIKTLAIPLNTVRSDKPQPYVQVVERERVRHQTVELGERGDADGQSLVAIKGVDENTRLLTGSVGTVRDGSLVKVIGPQSAALGAK